MGEETSRPQLVLRDVSDLQFRCMESPKRLRRVSTECLAFEGDEWRLRSPIETIHSQTLRAGYQIPCSNELSNPASPETLCIFKGLLSRVRQKTSDYKVVAEAACGPVARS